MTRKPWSDTEVEILIKRWNRGDPVKDIARDLGRSFSSVAGKALRLNLRLRGYSAKFYPTRKAA